MKLEYDIHVVPAPARSTSEIQISSYRGRSRVFINGHDVTDSVREIRWSHAVNENPLAEVVFAANVSAEVMALAVNSSFEKPATDG